MQVESVTHVDQEWYAGRNSEVKSYLKKIFYYRKKHPELVAPGEFLVAIAGTIWDANVVVFWYFQFWYHFLGDPDDVTPQVGTSYVASVCKRRSNRTTNVSEFRPKYGIARTGGVEILDFLHNFWS